MSVTCYLFSFANDSNQPFYFPRDCGRAFIRLGGAVGELQSKMLKVNQLHYTAKYTTSPTCWTRVTWTMCGEKIVVMAMSG